MKFLKKISIITSVFLLLNLSIIPQAFAKDTPREGRPNISYGSRYSFDKITYLGPFKDNEWAIRSTSKLYDDWDADTFSCYAPAANKSFSLTTTSKYEIQGSVSADVKKIIEAKLGITFGKTWSRTSTVSYTAEKNYRYTLWAANVRLVYDYECMQGLATPSYNPTKKAKVYTKYGSEQWFFREKLK